MIGSIPIALPPLQMIRHRVELLVAEVFARKWDALAPPPSFHPLWDSTQ
jgi:hypothetical protein